MSTILKALRRLEDDRNTGGARPLREEVASGGHGEPAPRRRGALLLVGTVALLAGVGAGAFAYWSASQGEAPATTGAPVVATGGATPPPTAQHTAEPESARRFAATESTGADAPDSELIDPLAAAPTGELPDAALTSRVERMDRPAREPRIGDEPVALATAAPPGAVAGRVVDPAQMPGRHKRPRARAVVPDTGGSTAIARAQAAPAREPERSAATPAPVAVRPPVSAQPKPAAQLRPQAAAADPWETAAAEAGAMPTRVADAPKQQTAPAPRTRAPEPDPPSSRGVVPERAPAPEPTPVARTPEAPAPSHATGAATPKPTTSQSAAATPKPSAAVAETPIAAASSVPSLSVERTSWHPSAERRTARVVVAGAAPREVREGDRVGALEIMRIEPSGVVFSRGGVEHRRRVGQSD